MAVEDKEFKDNFKKELFEQMLELSKGLTPWILEIQSLQRYKEIDTNIPNIAIHLNNKIIELERKFLKSGISIYPQKENDGTFIGMAVLSDLGDYAFKATENMYTCYTTIRDIKEKKTKKSQHLKKFGPIGRVFSNIRNFFIAVQNAIQERTEIYTKEEIDTINLSIAKYKDIDNQIWNYNLRDTIVSSITKAIRKKEFPANVVPILLEKNINSDLQKLGLGDLIPALQETLIAEYKKELTNQQVSQINEKDMYRFVPDFNRESKDDRGTEITENKSLKNGVTLKDFSSIDKQVKASDRQGMVDIIGEEQKTEEGKDSEKWKKEWNEDDDISL